MPVSVINKQRWYALRASMGLTQEEFGEIMGVSVYIVRAVENGNRGYEYESIINIEKKFDRHISDILSLDHISMARWERILRNLPKKKANAVNEILDVTTDKIRSI